jgi:ABC-2 type transport system ATP-binding protein
VDEGTEELVARLAAAGLTAVKDGDLVVIPLLDDRPYDVVRDAAADLGLSLVRMERRRHTLQELFRAPAGAHTSEGAHGTRA